MNEFLSLVCGPGTILMRRPRDEDGALLKTPLYRLQYGRNFKIFSDECGLNAYPEKLLDEERLLTLPILEISFCLFFRSAYLFQNAPRRSTFLRGRLLDSGRRLAHRRVSCPDAKHALCA